MSTTSTAAQRPLISRFSALTLGGFLLIMFVVGSIWDLEISETILNPDSWLAFFFAAFGELPASLGMAAGGFILVLFSGHCSRGYQLLLAFGGLGLLGAGTFLAFYLPSRYLEFHVAVEIGFGILATATACLIALRLSRGVHPHTVIRVALIVALVVATELAIVTLMKMGWQRPRMRFLIMDPGIGFSPWWAPGTEEASGFIASGVSSDEFKSFPSGHTANGAALILLTALIPLRITWQKYAPVFFWIGALWGIAVGAYRVVMGAHFVTDTVAGFTITFIVILVAYRIVFPQGLPRGSQLGSQQDQQQDQQQDAQHDLPPGEPGTPAAR